jgi:hypothetical protein
MKISIEEELLKVQKQDDFEKSSNANLAEIKQLLADNASEDVRILRALSKNSEFNRIEKIQGDKLDIENLEKKYNGNVFHIEKIKKLALEYRLRFLPSKLYTGSYDVELTAKIKEFAKETKISINDYSLNNDYYILAPKEMFELKEEKYISKKQLDPLIFYKVDNEHFRLIHKWGDDFTIMRFFEGFRWEDRINYGFFNMAISFPIVSFFVGLLLGPHFVSNLPFITFLLTLIPSLVVIRCFVLNKIDDGDTISGFFSDTAWNSNKQIKN